jgi:hypothetical protein
VVVVVVGLVAFSLLSPFFLFFSPFARAPASAREPARPKN